MTNDKADVGVEEIQLRNKNTVSYFVGMILFQRIPDLTSRKLEVFLFEVKAVFHPAKNLSLRVPFKLEPA